LASTPAAICTVWDYLTWTTPVMVLCGVQL
jgi:hypothetical protein